MDNNNFWNDATVKEFIKTKLVSPSGEWLERYMREFKEGKEEEDIMLNKPVLCASEVNKAIEEWWHSEENYPEKLYSVIEQLAKQKIDSK